MSDVENPKDAVKRAARSAAPPKPDRMDRVEVPEAMRQFVETGMKQAKDVYARVRSAAEEATDLVEDAYANATKGITEYNLMALDAFRAQVNANFDYTRDLLSAKSLSEAIELSTSHAREQFETLATQTRELATLAQKVAADASEPFRSGVNRALRSS